MSSSMNSFPHARHRRYQFRVYPQQRADRRRGRCGKLALALRDELRGRGFARAARLEIVDSCPKPVADFPCTIRARRGRCVPLRRSGQRASDQCDLRSGRTTRLNSKNLRRASPRDHRRAQPVRGDRRTRSAAASIRSSRSARWWSCSGGGERSVRARHQADPVPHRQRFGAGQLAGRCRARGQGRHRRRRAARALRRGSQYQSRRPLCRKPACRSSTAWSASRRMRRCC